MSASPFASEREDVSRFTTPTNREQTEQDFRVQAASMTREAEPMEEGEAKAKERGDKGDGRGDATSHMALRPTPDGSELANVVYGHSPDNSTDAGLVVAAGLGFALGREQQEQEAAQQANGQPQEARAPETGAAAPEAPQPKGRSFEDMQADGPSRPNYGSLKYNGEDLSRFSAPKEEGPVRPGASADKEGASRFISPEVAAKTAEQDQAMAQDRTRFRGLDFG